MLKKIAAYFSTILLLLFIGIESNAQNAIACFTPSAVKGCAPLTITLDISCAVYNTGTASPQYDYDDPNDPSGDNTNSTTHTPIPNLACII